MWHSLFLCLWYDALPGLSEFIWLVEPFIHLCVCVWVEGEYSSGGCRFGVTRKLPCSKSNHLCEMLLV